MSEPARRRRSGRGVRRLGAAPSPRPKRWPRPSFETRLLLLALAGSLPAATVAALFLGNRFSGLPALGVIVLVYGLAIGLPLVAHRRLTYTLYTLTNLLEALREGDFSLRARAAFGSGPMQEVMREINDLGSILREQRLGALEASALLRKVIDALDVAVFAFDEESRLALVNPAGARLLGEPMAALLERPAADLGLAELLSGPGSRLVDRAFPGRAARWDVRRTGFRKDGLPVRLLVLSDLSRPLREEERQAWKRLIRVLGHELNNSLAPIRSTAETLGRLLDREPRPADWEDDARRTLEMISDRSEALSRFMAGYSRLARLPAPTIRDTPLGALVVRVARLETRVPVAVVPGPRLTVAADPDQLEQALINLVQNAAEASLDTGGGVRLGWRAHGDPDLGGVELWVEDSGPGLSNPENLFVPFYTTKPSGTGIGLVLSRQVAEAHGGTVTLEERSDARGCVARLRLGGAGNAPRAGQPVSG